MPARDAWAGCRPSEVGAAVDADLGAGDEPAVLGTEHRDHRRHGLRAREALAERGESFANRLMSAPAGSPGPVLCLLAPLPSVMPEEMEPGCTAVKRMPCLAYSLASACVMDWMPPLLAAYAAM